MPGGSARVSRRPSAACSLRRPRADARHKSALLDFAEAFGPFKEQNRGQARDLPNKLAMLGYVLRQDAPAGAAPLDRSDRRAGRAAGRREHERWVAHKVKTGWRHGDSFDEAKMLHPCIVPWEKLPEDERVKDRLLVLHLPEIVAAAGLTMARCEALDPLRIGVTGHRVLADIELVRAGVEKALARIEGSHPGGRSSSSRLWRKGPIKLVTEAVLRRPDGRLELCCRFRGPTTSAASLRPFRGRRSCTWSIEPIS